MGGRWAVRFADAVQDRSQEPFEYPSGTPFANEQQHEEEDRGCRTDPAEYRRLAIALGHDQLSFVSVEITITSEALGPQFLGYILGDLSVCVVFRVVILTTAGKTYAQRYHDAHQARPP